MSASPEAPRKAPRSFAVVDRPLRVAHLTTIDMSLALLLGVELSADVDAGHEVFGISAPGPYVSEIHARGVTHVPVPKLTRAWDLVSDLAAARELWAVIRDLRLDVLHTHTPKAGVIGRVLGRTGRVPVVVNTCHGLWASADDPWSKRALVYGVEAMAAQFSHFELFQSGADRAALKWAVPERRARVVGNGVDLERFGFDPEGRERVRAEWRVEAETVLVGGVGRRVAEKGIVELATAARLLGPRARFVWVGPADVDKADRIDEDIDGITFVGERADMPAVYSAFDVFVLPSHREGFSRSAMEAAACGRPMVLSDIRGCREVGTHGENLVLVPPRNPQLLSVAIESLVDDPRQRDRLGAAAAKRARETFDQRAVAAISLETYAEVARRKGISW